MNRVVINFNSPIATRNRFDALCRASGKTRTAALVHLMENFILTQSKVLADRKAKFDEFDDLIGYDHHSTGDWDTPPSFFYTDGQDTW